MCKYNLFLLSGIIFLRLWVLYVHKSFDCRKLPCLRETSLIKEKSLLVEIFWIMEKYFSVENFLDQGKTFSCGKLPWSRKVFAWENFLDHEKILDWGNLPWSRKSLDLWKNLNLRKVSLIKEKSWFVEKFDCGKIIGLNLLKIKFYNKTNTSIEIIKVYNYLNLELKLNLLPFC